MYSHRRCCAHACPSSQHVRRTTSEQGVIFWKPVIYAYAHAAIARSNVHVITLCCALSTLTAALESHNRQLRPVADGATHNPTTSLFLRLENSHSEGSGYCRCTDHCSTSCSLDCMQAQVRHGKCSNKGAACPLIWNLKLGEKHIYLRL